MSRKLIEDMIKTKKELENIPVIANVDCGHTVPMLTFPYGGELKMSAGPEDSAHIIINHY